VNLGSTSSWDDEKETRLEKVLESCNSIKDIHAAAKNHPDFQDESTDSVQPPILLLSSLFQRLKLDDDLFSSS